MSGARSNPPTRRSSNRPRCAATRWSRRWRNWRAITFNCAARRRRSPSPTRIWLSRERSRKSRRSGKGRASPPASTRKPRPRRPKAFPRAFRRCGRMNRNIRTRSAFCWTSRPARCKGSSGRASARWRRPACRRSASPRNWRGGVPTSAPPRRGCTPRPPTSASPSRPSIRRSSSTASSASTRSTPRICLRPVRCNTTPAPASRCRSSTPGG